MWKRRPPRLPEVEAEIRVCIEPGITPVVARQLIACANRLDCRAQLRSTNGGVAEMTQMLDLLVLGVRTGDLVSLRCVGRDAEAGWQALATILASGHPIL